MADSLERETREWLAGAPDNETLRRSLLSRWLAREALWAEYAQVWADKRTYFSADAVRLRAALGIEEKS